MLVKNELRSDLPESTELAELNELEWTVIKMFRQIDELGQRDIILFLRVFLPSK